jgi:hypothetical protein
MARSTVAGIATKLDIPVREVLTGLSAIGIAAREGNSRVSSGDEGKIRDYFESRGPKARLRPIPPVSARAPCAVEQSHSASLASPSPRSPGARISPPIDEIPKLPDKLNEGELQVLDALAGLDSNWRVYVQPKFLDQQPDFLVVHDTYGVCLIEVKAWTPELYRQEDNGSISVRDSRGWQPTSEAPRLQAYRYRSIVFERFFAEAVSPDRDFAVVRAAIVLPAYRTQDARKLLCKPHPLGKGDKNVDQFKFIAVWGGDGLANDLLQIVTGYRRAYGMDIAPGYIKKLEYHLAEPSVAIDQRGPLVLSAAAKNLETNPSNAKMRRARGPSGSGKSIGLAARAAKLALQGRKVLVLGYNITLPHYLHDLASRHARELGCNIRNITFGHFHHFYPDIADRLKCERTASSDIAKCSEPSANKFDAILVDEGQDFRADWWNFLRQCVLAPGGEMLLVADTTQDLYDTSSWTAEESMRGCGFSGPWTELPGCYRMPPDMIPIARAFGEQYLRDADFDPPTVLHDHPMLNEAWEPTKRKWLNLRSTMDIPRAIAGEVERLMQEDELPLADIVFLCEEHAYGLQASRLLSHRGVHLRHIFTEEDGEERRRRKLRFWPGSDGVKGATVHSFKGWESRAVILCILPGARSARLAYVAMTRVKGDARAFSLVTVLNSNPLLADFKAEFERDITAEEVPELRGQRRLL